MINPDAYYVVQGWMINELGLKGNALAVYAIIYGFSQDGETRYSGSSRYLSEWLGCSKKTVLSTLSNLVDAGLLQKRTVYQNGVTFCNYVALRDPKPPTEDDVDGITPPVKNLHQGGEEITPGGENISPGVVKNLHRGGEKTSLHNTRDNTRYIYTREINIGGGSGGRIEAASPPPPSEKKKKPEAVRHKYGEYKNVLLTDEQLADLKKIFPQDYLARIDRLSEYIETSGKGYKNHYATIKAWARRDRKESFRAASGHPANVGPNGIKIDPTKNDLDGIFR